MEKSLGMKIFCRRRNILTVKFEAIREESKPLATQSPETSLLKENSFLADECKKKMKWMMWLRNGMHAALRN